MKVLVPIHSAVVDALKCEKETGPGYHVVAIELKDGRHFDQAVVSEGCIIWVRGHSDIPFDLDDIASVKLNHRHWNFRTWIDVRRVKARAASA
jgi:hypothetical protein